MRRFKVMIRRDTFYDVRGINELDAIEAAKNEIWDQIIESELDLETSLVWWEVDEDGKALP